MDPALLREKEAFRKRALAIPVIEKRPEQKSASAKTSKTKKKKSKLQKPKPKPLEDVAEIKQAASQGRRTKNPYRLLKAVVDLMRQRYMGKNYEPLSLEEVLAEIDLTDLDTDTRQWLNEALRENAKIEHYTETNKFLFKPYLGLTVRNRHQLLHKLKEYSREGLGGVLMSDIKEALPSAEKSIQKLKDSNDIMVVTRGDKEEIVFYNNREYEMQVDEEFKSLWRAVGVDHLSEGDVEKYLQNVGLAAMQGEERKRKAPGQKKPPKKKQRAHKMLNTHLLDTDLLKDYSEGT